MRRGCDLLDRVAFWTRGTDNNERRQRSLTSLPSCGSMMATVRLGADSFATGSIEAKLLKCRVNLFQSLLTKIADGQQAAWGSV